MIIIVHSVTFVIQGLSPAVTILEFFRDPGLCNDHHCTQRHFCHSGAIACRHYFGCGDPGTYGFAHSLGHQLEDPYADSNPWAETRPRSAPLHGCAFGVSSGRKPAVAPRPGCCWEIVAIRALAEADVALDQLASQRLRRKRVAVQQLQLRFLLGYFFAWLGVR
jgi:hypothetical protein